MLSLVSTSHWDSTFTLIENRKFGFNIEQSDKNKFWNFIVKTKQNKTNKHTPLCHLKYLNILQQITAIIYFFCEVTNNKGFASSQYDFIDSFL